MVEVENGDRQGIEDLQVDIGVDEVVVEVEDTETVEGMEVVMEVEVVVEEEEHHLEVLHPKVWFLWKQERLSIHSGIFDPCNSRVLEQWPQK